MCTQCCPYPVFEMLLEPGGREEKKKQTFLCVRSNAVNAFIFDVMFTLLVD